jgi:alpha-galactosidase
MKSFKRILPIILINLFYSGFLNAQEFKNVGSLKEADNLSHCKATLSDGILTLENKLIKRNYKWNEGDLISQSVTDLMSHYTWFLDGKKADCSFPIKAVPKEGKLEVRKVGATLIAPTHLEADVYTKLGDLEIKRVFRIYADCPAIGCDYYLRGNYTDTNLIDAERGSQPELKSNNAVKNSSVAYIERIALPTRHLQTKAVQFFDVTDFNNNLVREVVQTPFWRESTVSGNLLFIQDQEVDKSIFILKEAPTSTVQLASPGYDFSIKTSEIVIAGIGAVPVDLHKDSWLRCYGFVTGVSSGGQYGALTALRSYQEVIRIQQPHRDDMIMMNTWGDRNQDKRISEKFTKDELIAANKLGITHFQIDDGWQTGRSKNSALAVGSLNNIWKNPNYWYPDPVKFPNGLTPVVELAKKLGIEVCLWFNPSIDSSFNHWRDDANTLIRLYRRYGIRTFKIDGVNIPNKLADVNFRKLLDSVVLATNHQAVFNLDVTAGKRTGFHYFNDYGNIFLENRYTDWSNYYPHWTLRNLWMLSKYVPAQNLQVEFLNIFRNKDKYAPNDFLAPNKLPFEYTFAITMMAQPLAWMEATGLPDEGFKIGPVIKKYQGIQSDIHAGKIFPIGDEPSGISWTGFQSIQKDRGYILVFREGNDKKNTVINTWLQAGKRVELKKVLGQGKNINTVVGDNGRISFTLPQKNNYVLYEYRILNHLHSSNY